MPADASAHVGLRRRGRNGLPRRPQTVPPMGQVRQGVHQPVPGDRPLRVLLHLRGLRRQERQTSRRLLRP